MAKSCGSELCNSDRHAANSAQPIPRPRPLASCHIGRVRKATPVDRQAAATNALGKPGPQAQQLGDALIDALDLVAKTISTYGRIDVAFNNAGTEGGFTPFIDQSNEVYDTIFNANVRGVFWSMKHEAKAMLAQGGGAIINNASMGGVIGFGNAGLYVASKHAVLGLTKTASIELFKQGVRVNSICPSIIDTPFQDRIWPSTEEKQAFAASTVPGRAGAPEEIATVVAFLASDDASFVSGHGLLADGGYSIA